MISYALLYLYINHLIMPCCIHTKFMRFHPHTHSFRHAVQLNLSPSYHTYTTPPVFSQYVAAMYWSFFTLFPSLISHPLTTPTTLTLTLRVISVFSILGGHVLVIFHALPLSHHSKPPSHHSHLHTYPTPTCSVLSIRGSYVLVIFHSFWSRVRGYTRSQHGRTVLFSDGDDDRNGISGSNY